ncbi:arabinogalactan oligomer/maltooligosaccharide transport system permease protein [Hydrogenispora ethanolica]|uniref:Arabinogalactan oligomer/maltooligosaccharide transport system permease protein n=1 Tax=Hydrogenispora ethanolica TaxID=1082276 RepID=A0A4V6NGS4_HYDET|nr:sugar ABC transporter permease [Hydrogenispora ethanolica]TCL62057.1 arabinogalactan oligomer/maltooligosaccharide transport system permease protein [Hydrogenispora ethanolica]
MIVKRSTPYLLIGPALLVLLFMIGYPLVFGVQLSFTNMNLYHFLQYQYVGLKNYLSVLTDPELYTTAWRTVVWTVVNVTLTVLIGLGLAILLNRKLPFKNLLRVLLMLPWAVPQYIAVLTWRNMFQAQYGTIDIILNRLGITSISWLSDPAWTFIACIITNIWLGVPFMMVIALGAMQSIPAELYEVAAIDGIKSWQKHRHITLPLLKPVMTPAIVLSTVWTFNMVNVIYMMTGRTGDNQTQILVSRVYKDAFTYFNYSKAATFSVLIFLILALFASSYLKLMRSGEGVYD